MNIVLPNKATWNSGRAGSPSFDWGETNIKVIEQYERALKIAQFKAEKALGYSLYSNAHRPMKPENFKMDQSYYDALNGGKKAFIPNFSDIKKQSMAAVETELKEKNFKKIQ